LAITVGSPVVGAIPGLMSPGVRRLALVMHIVASVGWLGSVAVFLVLAAVGLTSGDDGLVRASYVSADVVTRLVIVPLCLVALVTGLVQSLGTAWGLFRNYWVIAKLVLTLLGTGLLFLHTGPIALMARVASTAGSDLADHRQLQVQLVADAAAAVVLLLVTTGLSVFKPRGVTPYGWRKQREERSNEVLNRTGSVTP
jgi:hypothetical protein